MQVLLTDHNCLDLRLGNMFGIVLLQQLSDSFTRTLDIMPACLFVFTFSSQLELHTCKKNPHFKDEIKQTFSELARRCYLTNGDAPMTEEKAMICNRLELLSIKEALHTDFLVSQTLSTNM